MTFWVMSGSRASGDDQRRRGFLREPGMPQLLLGPRADACADGRLCGCGLWAPGLSLCDLRQEAKTRHLHVSLLRSGLGALVFSTGFKRSVPPRSAVPASAHASRTLTCLPPSSLITEHSLSGGVTCPPGRQKPKDVPQVVTSSSCSLQKEAKNGRAHMHTDTRERDKPGRGGLWARAHRDHRGRIRP